MKTANTAPEVIEAIIDVNTRSAAAKELAIFEIGSLNDLIPLEKAEHIRKQLQTNKTYVRQLTNLRRFEA